MMSVPFHKPYFDESEIEAVTRAMRRGLIGLGPNVSSFEREFGQYVGAGQAIAVNSCTSALHLALDSFGIGPGDEVITTPLTFCATVLSIQYTGASPVFADINPDTLCIDPASVLARITPRTRAIIAVHYGGYPCELDALRRICAQHHLLLVEDAAHAFSAIYKGRRIGDTSGEVHGATCFSFHATKALSIGDGGMITTSDTRAAGVMMSKRLFGMARMDEHEAHADVTLQYSVETQGYKYNMTDLEAAIGRVQLKKADRMHDLRRRAAQQYSSQLQDVPGLVLPKEPPDGAHAWHLYAIRVPKPLRSGLIRHLLAEGIKTTIHFTPIYRFPHFKKDYPDAVLQLPNTEAAADELLSLPIYPSLKEEEIRAVSSAVRMYLSKEAG